MTEKKHPDEEPILEPETNPVGDAHPGVSNPTDPDTSELTDGPPGVRPLQELEEALVIEHDRYLRLAAEYDNFRKRSQKERESLYVDVKADIVAMFLPVYDNLERALGQETEDKAYYRGVEMIMTQLREIFQKLGVREIPARGETFDPALHNAVSHVEDEAYGESEIVEQFMAGFQLGDKVIRHSMVKVAN